MPLATVAVDARLTVSAPDPPRTLKLPRVPFTVRLLSPLPSFTLALPVMGVSSSTVSAPVPPWYTKLVAVPFETVNELAPLPRFAFTWFTVWPLRSRVTVLSAPAVASMLILMSLVTPVSVVLSAISTPLSCTSYAPELTATICTAPSASPLMTKLPSVTAAVTARASLFSSDSNLERRWVTMMMPLHITVTNSCSGPNSPRFAQTPLAAEPYAANDSFATLASGCPKDHWAAGKVRLRVSNPDRSTAPRRHTEGRNPAKNGAIRGETATPPGVTAGLKQVTAAGLAAQLIKNAGFSEKVRSFDFPLRELARIGPDPRRIGGRSRGF